MVGKEWLVVAGGVAAWMSAVNSQILVAANVAAKQ